MKRADKRQQDMFQAETHYFHVLKELVETGKWAAMAPSSAKVYVAVKAYSKPGDGRAFPSIPDIVAKSGVTRRSVDKALDELETMGLIDALREPGKRTIYTLKEIIGIHDQDGKHVADATFPYIGMALEQARTEIKNIVMNLENLQDAATNGPDSDKGKTQGRVIQIANLQINFNMAESHNTANGGQQVNAEVSHAGELGKVLSSLKEAMGSNPKLSTGQT